MIGIVSNIHISSKIISVDGEVAAIFLIIMLTLSFILSETEYWDDYISNTINILSDPLLILFIAIVVFNIIMMIKK